jgi:hypothetical protein
MKAGKLRQEIERIRHTQLERCKSTPKYTRRNDNPRR